MPNTREKLIELLQTSPMDIMGNHGVGALADHLIANGVTVQKWIPVTERLPEKFHSVLATRKVGDWFSIDVESIGATGKWSGDIFTDNEVTHWIPLPEPPREGER